MAVLYRALRSAAEGGGSEVAAVTVSIDHGDLGGEPLPSEVTAQVDRSTRSLVFVSGELRDDAGLLLAAASGVFRRLAG